MNELLQKHGCSNVFTVPEGLKELMADITREVLRRQPDKIFDFIANYLSVLLITREHGVMAVKILEDLCDCRPSVSEHLIQLGVPRDQADTMAQIINDEIVALEPITGKEKVREYLIVKEILARITLDEDMSANVCQVIRNTYRDYWYRKKVLQENMKVLPTEPWEVAAQHTLDIYKRTKPSFDELGRATVKIQAAYRGYHIRRNVLRQFKKKKTGPKVELPGPPLDVAGSREIDLGRVIDIKTKEDDITGLFDAEAGLKLGLKYDPKKTITHVETDDGDDDNSSKTRGVKLSDNKKRFGGFRMMDGDETVLRTHVKSVFQPLQVLETMESEQHDVEGAVKAVTSKIHLSSTVIPAELAHFISFSDVPPEVFLLDPEPTEDDAEMLEDVAEEPEVKAPSPFIEVGDNQEIPEDIASDIDDDYCDDTVPSVSSAPTTDIEDIVSDVGEEDR